MVDESVAVMEVPGLRRARALVCLLFLTFAMTSDAVGSIIARVIVELHLSLTAAGAFQYVPMGTMAAGAFALGYLADRLGRKAAIIAGLVLYGGSSVLFAFGQTFGVFVGLLALSGLGISLFKTGALALIGDLSRSGLAHTRLMNAAEGFFGIGSIAGPAIVAALLAQGLSWKWLYVAAAVICALLIVPKVPSSIRGARRAARVWLRQRESCKTRSHSASPR
jgi:fucose permease